MSAEEAFSPQSSLGYQVNHLARLLAAALRERIEPLGVVPGQFAQLLVLYEQDGLTQGELCARVHVEQPTMANTLARMQRDGLIDRVPDPHDKRRSLVMLTARARALRGDLVAAARAVNATATRGLGTAEATVLMSTINAAITNLSSDTDHLAHPPDHP
ncbi:MarR family winged helix-turn-helix transcriptional regulator [Janibacter alittae]|uniref:MarR family winged helix-turn-helix transcriptional regulator n=1 Tax=Janibacter alittae TaxID=3115209 RepID=A0ABZ2MJ66_9MICO